MKKKSGKQNTKPAKPIVVSAALVTSAFFNAAGCVGCQCAIYDESTGEVIDCTVGEFGSDRCPGLANTRGEALSYL